MGLLWPPVTLCFHFWHKQLIAVDFWLLQDVSPIDAMLSKNALPKLDEEPDPHRRLKANVKDLFLTNQVSAARASSLFSDAASAGVQALQDVAGLEAKANRNVHRDLLRKLAKKSKDWPQIYWAKIDFWHPKKQKVQKEWLAFLLPHEWLGKLAARIKDASLLATWQGLGPTAQSECARAAQELQCKDLIPLSFWCDGVPYNWDRSQSLEVMNLGMPGVPEWMNLRIPFTCFEHKRLSTNTFEQIFEILIWSLQSLACGEHPLQRHDFLDWLPTDKARKRFAGKQYGLRAALSVVKADWKAFKDIFHFPGWQGDEGCCWLCKATVQDMRSKPHTADMPLDHWSFLQRQKYEYGKPVSTLLAAPTLRLHQFKPDWLHTMDQGCTADFLGIFFLWILLPKMHGRNQTERIRSLFVLIEEYYSQHPVQQRYNTLTVKMLQKKPTSAPKLRGRASEVKGLVLFGKIMAEKYCRDDDLVEHSVKMAAHHLNNLYTIVWNRTSFSPAAMHTESFKLRALLRALDAHHPQKNMWRLKPKMHLMEEMCEKAQDNPLDSATYRDEDWGGAVARWAKRRAGKNTVASTAHNVLTKFCANNKLPDLC